MRSTKIQISVRDLSQYGLRLIAPTDQLFDRRAQTFLKSLSPETIQTIKPLSVILENTGDLAIVGTRLNWEILKSDGTIVSMPVGSANPRALIDGGESKGLQTSGGAALRSHSARFISLLGSAANGEELDVRNSWLSFKGSKSEMDAFNAALAQGNRQDAFERSVLGQLLKEAREITVSIDGVFFEDGTFVGENKTGFFENIKAYVDAEYDLAYEISTASKEGKTPDDICEQVRAFLVAHTQTNQQKPLSGGYPGVRPTTDREITSLASVKFSSLPYENYKTLLAQQFLMRKSAIGASQTIAEVLKLLEKPRVPLVKR